MKFNEETKTNLWDIANKLRGNVAENDYKDIVLGIVFLRYADVTFQKQYENIQKEDARFVNDIEEYHKIGIFYLPEEARYEYLLNMELGQLNSGIDDALEIIMKNNKSLIGVLNKCYTRLDVDPGKLKEVMRLIGEMESEDGTTDYLGEIYMYFMSKFSIKDGTGEFFTPNSIVELLVRIINPINGVIYDPACGSGGMFIHALDRIKALHKNPNDLQIYGQELNTATWRLAKMNLAIHQITNDKIGSGGSDTFLEDIHPTLRADFILANPPFNIKDWGFEKVINDRRWKYGIPPKGNANYAWLSHILYHLKDNGKAGIVLANGSLSTNNKDELSIRKSMIENNLVDCIISLPDKLFPGTGIPCCLWILNKNKSREDILFIEGSNIEGRMISRSLRELKESDLEMIVNLYTDFNKNKDINKLGLAKSISIKNILKGDYSLTPGRYIEVEEVIDVVPFEEKINNLYSKLDELFKNDEIYKNKILKNKEEITDDRK